MKSTEYILGTFCGNEKINDITIDIKAEEQKNVKFDFISDFSINRGGFAVTFESS